MDFALGSECQLGLSKGQTGTTSSPQDWEALKHKDALVTSGTAHSVPAFPSGAFLNDGYYGYFFEI